MAWKATFDEGVACFKRGDLDDALAHMNEAAELESNAFIIYDSRAAVHEKFGHLKAALLDSKRVIDLAPDRWQGYARSARLFDLVGKYGSAVKMAEHALSRLRPEDAQRRTQLVELREQAIAAQAKVTKTSYLLGKLPVETLVEIFSILIDEDHTWAIRLSHVCGHWRQILINTPSAWQTLVLAQKRPLQKAKLWKQRARNRITRISIATSELDRATVLAQLGDLSWDDLSSLCTFGDVFAELHRMLVDTSRPYTFSKLDELNLASFAPEQLSCCLSGPNWKLRTLRLRGDVTMVDEWWQRIQRLEELHLIGSIIDFSMLMFTANPSLEKLVLSCTRIRVSSDNEGPAHMGHLKSIECRSAINPFDCLGALTAPSITHFSMSSAIFSAEETLLRTASRPSLVELHVAHCCLSASTLPKLLSSTPNLETLRINSMTEVVNEMFQFLTPKAIDALPCRALQHVDVSSCSDLTTWSVHAFIKMRAQYASESAESAGTCTAIASLRVDGCPNIEPDMLPWFRSKVAQFSCVYATRKDFRKNRR